MSKPSNPIKHTGLNITVKKEREEHKDKRVEYPFVVPVASDYLLEKLCLPEETLQKAKQLEAHSFRVLEASSKVNEGIPITIRVARAILEKAAQSIPGYIERNKKWLDRQSIPTTLSTQFLQTARQLQFDELRQLIGEKTFDKYTKNLRRVFKALQRTKPKNK
jgi:hypothetical protein